MYFLSKIFKKRNVLISFLLVIVIGILKEVFDSQNTSMHSVEVYDVLYTIIGGLLGVIISLI
jgi:VanZ family protein